MVATRTAYGVRFAARNLLLLLWAAAHVALAGVLFWPRHPRVRVAQVHTSEIQAMLMVGEELRRRGRQLCYGVAMRHGFNPEDYCEVAR
jgi:hypothetical protein